jgi:hypothetical protein
MKYRSSRQQPRLSGLLPIGRTIPKLIRIDFNNLFFFSPIGYCDFRRHVLPEFVCWFTVRSGRSGAIVSPYGIGWSFNLAITSTSTLFSHCYTILSRVSMRDQASPNEAAGKVVRFSRNGLA